MVAFYSINKIWKQKCLTHFLMIRKPSRNPAANPTPCTDRLLADRLSVCVPSREHPNCFCKDLATTNRCFHKALRGSACLSWLRGTGWTFTWAPRRNGVLHSAQNLITFIGWWNFWWSFTRASGFHFRHVGSSDWPVCGASWGLTRASLCKGKSDGFVPGRVSWLICVLIHMEMWCQGKNERV